MDSVRIVEVSPRDGLQNEKQVLPADVKVELVDRLSNAGFGFIEVTSFVSPTRIPQLADAADVMARIRRREGARYSVLVPNMKGYERAVAAKADSIVVFGDDNTPLFRGSPSFALGFAGNQDGRVYEWDTVRQRVRISPPGQPGAWVACNDVAPMTIACSGVLRISSEGKLVLENRRAGAGGLRGGDEGPVDSAGVPPGAVPNCPGDPRCPRVGG